MKKLLLIALIVGMISAPAAFADKFCTDADGGADIWTGSYAETEKGIAFDDCNGASHNLKEQYCDAANGKFDNIKCTDFGAVCVSVTGGDYCACVNGTVRVGDSCQVVSDVPEFGTIGAAVGLAGLGVGYLLLRKKA